MDDQRLSKSTAKVLESLTLRERVMKPELDTLMRMRVVMLVICLIFIFILIFPLSIAIVEIRRHGPKFIVLLVPEFVPKHTHQLQQPRLGAPDFIGRWCWWVGIRRFFSWGP